MATQTTDLAHDLDAFAASLPGRVVLADDATRYDELRAVFNGMIDRRPLAIVRVADDEDVVAALAFARRHRLPVAVRSGGHSAPGHGVLDGGIVIDVRALTSVEVDPAARTVRCGAGLDWGALDRATQEHGLAVTGGRVSSTGVSGFSIGSGSGWLERTWGLATDRLIRLRLVTADGRVVRASEDEHRELLWASRGGGGNFGVITEMTFALRRLGPIVFGGPRFYPMDRATEVIRAYRDVFRTAPAELGGGLQLVWAPPAPFIPPRAQAKPCVAVFVIWAGEHADAQRGVAPLDALGEPLADLAAPSTYVDLQAMSDPAYPYGMRDYFKGGFIDELTDEAIDTLVQLGADLRAPLSNIILLPLGAATDYARYTEEHSPLGTRDAQWTFQVLSLWSDPAEDELHREWTREVARTMSTYSALVSFPNFVAIDDGARATESFSPRAMERLRAVKRRWDPENVFRRTVVPLGD
jgi:FAD/FMN-containing dehydrogenase